MKKRHAIIFLKLLFIIASFSVVFIQADILKIWGYIKNANPLYMLLAYAVMTLAQVISGQRMRFYYSREGLNLNSKFCTGLYFTSMLFNTVLPGGIGGDGYKIYTIGNLSGFSHLKAFKIAISERASGLFALLFLIVIFYIYTDFASVVPYQNYIISGLTVLLIPAYFISIKILLKEKVSTALGAALYSFPVQLLNVVVALILIIDLGADVTDVNKLMGYMVIFLVSSVVSILPITIGGAGIREVTFLYGANLTGLNPELGIALAVLFFVINILCSLNGLLFWHRLKKLYQ